MKKQELTFDEKHPKKKFGPYIMSCFPLQTDDLIIKTLSKRRFISTMKVGNVRLPFGP